MIAFVLSGGGNRGALQVGALQVLLEAGLRPEMLVGTSAGAINATFLAADLATGRPFLFGDDPEGLVLDAVMASISVPSLYAPWPHRGRLLVDGGVAANLPVGVAVEKGATEVYALEIWGGEPPRKSHWNLWEIAAWSIGALMRQQWERDLALCAAHPEVTLHHLPLYTERPLAFDDFNQAAELIGEGRAAAEAYLAAWNLPAITPEDEYVSGWQRALCVRYRLDGVVERARVALAPLASRMGSAGAGSTQVLSAMIYLGISFGPVAR